MDIKLTQTNDIGMLLNAINHIEISKRSKWWADLTNFNLDGQADFFNAIKVSQLSLKHRQNKSQRQRIIIFIGQ